MAQEKRHWPEMKQKDRSFFNGADVVADKLMELLRGAEPRLADFLDLISRNPIHNPKDRISMNGAVRLLKEQIMWGYQSRVSGDGAQL